MTHVIDGGLSTELERLGASFDGPLWTGRTLLESPELIQRAHEDFIDAGAEVIITSSYQISRRGFIEVGLTAEQADQALIQSVKTARAAVGNRNVKVAASLGPYGATLHDGSEYVGNYGISEDELTKFHEERIEVLLKAQPDILLAETIPDLTEAKALARALKDVDIPVWICFTAGDKEVLWSGDRIVEAIEALSSIKSLEVIGFNCVHPDLISELVKTAKTATDLPIAVYPNRGGSWDATKSVWTLDDKSSFTDYLQDWSKLGIEYIGGCCGLDSTDISELKKVVS
jgi:homocysteine S-methyltransferase